MNEEIRKKKVRLEKRPSSEGVRAKHERKASGGRKMKMKLRRSEGNKEMVYCKISRRRKIRPEQQCSHEGIGIVLEDALEISRKRQIEHLEYLMKEGKPNPMSSEVTFHPWSCMADVALMHYHKEQGIEFHLLQMVKKNGKIIPPFSSLEPGIYFHIFFKAVPRNVDCVELSPQLFFAEIFDCGVKFHPTHCFVIKPDDDPVHKRRLGCGVCPDDEEFPHPSTGFNAGHFPYVGPVML
ncbi:glyoxal reductase [Striga asiatica]|uniref:Glyoxal reductase n=1 Tax=Striga asiatica TaxID=4170 RepID=A0A5A7QMD3_STRAF|nr:glyoxal reductase [Striga asiatica]